MSYPRKNFLLVFIILLPLAAFADERGLRVIASIKPVHSLVAGVMKGAGEPALLLQGNVSEHNYSMRPSDVRKLNNARVVFWIGRPMETYLVRPLNGVTARNVELINSPGVELLARREGGLREPHRDQPKEDDQYQEPTGKIHEAKNGHEPTEPHHGDYDAHIWLDPQNAIAMVRQISAVLIEVDGERKEVYQTNAAALIKRLQSLDKDLASKLAPIKDKPYIVFHDAYQYFEQRYGLAMAGSITLSPEQHPGTRRLQEIRNRIATNQVICVFSEPQFKPALVHTLIEGTTARSGVLDPVGADLTEGPDSYFQLLTNLANSLRSCLQGTG